MATAAEWIEGARPRTLPAALAPVLAGSAVAWFEGAFSPLLAVLALVVALALQVGVNFANDYSDGIRGTDAARVGPLRLVGSGLVEPRRVRAAAFGCFALAAAAGLAVVVVTGHWWLLAVGAAAIAAAWFYTGGRRPYGYLGLGEVFVFLFFGLVAVAGTVYIQVGRVSPAAWWTAVAIGALACAILVANNLRDLDGDRAAGKRTLATRLGDTGTRWFFLGLLAVAALGVVAVAATSSWWALLGLIMGLALVGPVREVLRGVTGRELIPVLKNTGLAELACAAGLFVGLWIAR
ncbi:MAG: 1,4-dihydroxy-2-naphthoate polyprenyltransferase [Actinobacteria bacterium]|nr:1,4-dihydroxy-2-naphthoate polyprenyltransferase [Actinomycetota bacterium]